MLCKAAWGAAAAANRSMQSKPRSPGYLLKPHPGARPCKERRKSIGAVARAAKILGNGGLGVPCFGIVAVGTRRVEGWRGDISPKVRAPTIVPPGSGGMPTSVLRADFQSTG